MATTWRFVGIMPSAANRKLDHVTLRNHRHIERDKDIAHALPAIVLAVDVQNRQNDQISKDEAEQCLLCSISSVLYPRRERPKRRSRSELPTTVTDERAIAAAAKMGAWACKNGIRG